MKKISVLIFTVIFINCSNRKILKNSFDTKYLTNKSIKYWNIHPGSEGVVKENCWIFRQNGTFSYYDYLKYKQKGIVEIMQWLSYDIKVGENGIIPWNLKSDILEISRIKYKVLKLQNDSLIVESPKSIYSPVDTILFTYCHECPVR